MFVDMQTLFDAVSEANRQGRSRYHLTLGAAIEKLNAMDGSIRVVCSDNQDEAPGAAMSYRGYYSDLAFAPSLDTVTAAGFLAECANALGKTMEGYKGGDFLMGEDTPLWVSAYGVASGRAVMDIVALSGIAVLTIKNID